VSSTFSVSFSADSANAEDADLTLSLSKPFGSSVTFTDVNGSIAAADGKIATNTGKAATLTSTTIGDDTGTDDLITIRAGGVIAAATNTVAGTVRIKPDLPGTYVLTITGSDLGAPSVANAVVATFTVVATATNNTTSALRNSISLASATLAPTQGSPVNINFEADMDNITNQAFDESFSFIGYISEYPSGGFSQVSVSTTAPLTDTEIFVASGGTSPLVTESQSGSTYTVTLDGDSANEDYTGNTALATAAVGAAQFSFTPTKAGAYVLTVWADVNDNQSKDIGEAIQTIAITVAAKSGWSQGGTTVLSVGTTNTLADADTDALSKSAVKTLGQYAGTVVVTIKNTDGALYAGQTVTASVSGVGFVGGASATDGADADAIPGNQGTDIGTADGAATTTRSASVTDTTGVVAFGVWGDGLAGTSTVSITVTDQVSGASTVIGSEEFIFYGSVTTLAVSTTNFTIGLAGGDDTGASVAARTATGEVTNAGALTAGTTTPAFIVKATDSGSRVANAAAAPTVISSNTAAVTGGTCTLDDGATIYSSGDGVGYYNCNFTTAQSSKSGDKATLTIRIVNPADATTYLTTTLDVTVGGTVSTETLTFDKSSYAPGEAMVITRTAKDASGNPVADGIAVPAVTFNKAVGGTAPGASFYNAGTKATSSTSPTVYAPAISGEFIAKMTSGNAAATVITTTATVVNETENAATDAAQEATEAANAATDAANAAAEAADAATAAAQDAQAAVADLAAQVASMVASVRSQLTRLSNLIIKIQKKVRA
jgi:hypothetical protein